LKTALRSAPALDPAPWPPCATSQSVSYEQTVPPTSPKPPTSRLGSASPCRAPADQLKEDFAEAMAPHPYAVKAHLPGMGDYVTEYRDLGRRGARGRARRGRMVSPRTSQSRSHGCADDGDRRHPRVLRLPAEPARRTAHTSTTTYPGADLPPCPRRHRSRRTPPVRYSRPRRTVRYRTPNGHTRPRQQTLTRAGPATSHIAGTH
jgi:hypothetical protein